VHSPPSPAILPHPPGLANLARPDTLPMPSATRPGLTHLVAVNVLAGCTTGCSCEAGQRNQYCAHRKQVDSEEASYGFARCCACGSLMRLGSIETRSGSQRAWFCPSAAEHSAHEPGVAMLMRVPR